MLPSFDLDDIDLALVNDALRADGRPAVKRPHIERALVDFGLARPAVPPLDAQYLRAAALLFANGLPTTSPAPRCSSSGATGSARAPGRRGARGS